MKEALALNAYLVTDISYQKDGQELTVPAGTKIRVDAMADVALIGQDHVHLEADEYRICQSGLDCLN